MARIPGDIQATRAAVAALKLPDTTSRLELLLVAMRLTAQLSYDLAVGSREGFQAFILETLVRQYGQQGQAPGQTLAQALATSPPSAPSGSATVARLGGWYGGSPGGEASQAMTVASPSDSGARGGLHPRGCPQPHGDYRYAYIFGKMMAMPRMRISRFATIRKFVMWKYKGKHGQVPPVDSDGEHCFVQEELADVKLWIKEGVNSIP